MHKLSIFLFLLFSTSASFGQTKYFYGKLIDSLTLLPVQSAQVENGVTSETDFTNDRGLFLIKASKGDSLIIRRIGYFNETYVITGRSAAIDTLEIFLRPKTKILQSVTVSAYSYADYREDSILRRQTFGEDIGYAHPLIDNSNSGAGFGISLDRIFGKQQRNKKRAYKLFLQNEEQEYRDFRFNPILVHTYTGLRGEALQQFINRYQPSYLWLRQHTKPDDVMYYINSVLKNQKK